MLQKSKFGIISFLIIGIISCNFHDDYQIIDLDESNSYDTVSYRQKLNREGRIWDCEYINNYQIYIQPCLQNTPYFEAIGIALAEYNSIENTCLNMSITSNIAEAEVVLDCFCSPIYYGVTYNPNNNQQLTIMLNVYCDLFETLNCENEITPCHYAYVLLHELGHTLGFVHDENGKTFLDPNDLNSEVDNFIKIAGTPIRDPNSVFNGGGALANQEANFTICDLPCEFSEYDILAIQTIYPECAPDVPDYEVVFEPCFDLIRINVTNNQNVENYHWIFNNQMNNTPHISYYGTDNARVSLRAGYTAGERICFHVSAENCGAVTSLPCEVCYITPACQGNETPIIGTPINSCINNSCPQGYDCVDGICCRNDINPCQCPTGYTCVNGECCNQNGVCL